MRVGVVCSNTSGRWSRGTACRVTTPTSTPPCSLRGAVRQSGLERRLRLVVTHATTDPNRTPDASLNEIALKRYGKPLHELEPAERRWCISKKATDTRWQGHQGKPKPEDDPELQRIAQEVFGKPYQDLETHEKRVCAGKKGSMRTQAFYAANRKDKLKPVDPALQQIAQELFGKDHADLTADELRKCIAAKAGRKRWEGHEAKARPGESEALQRWAQTLYGRPYEELSTREKKTCVGKLGAALKYNGPQFQIDYSAMPLEEAKELLAQEKYAKPYWQLTSDQKKNVSSVLRSRVKALHERNQAIGANVEKAVDPNHKKPDQA